MKKTYGCFIVLIAVFFLVLPILSGCAEDTVQVKVELQYRYDMTESMLPLINELRTGDGAWYWNSDNSTKTVLTDLKPMTYDYGLEYTAMQRAAECALHYAHTRPDGTRCFAIYPSSGSGENIAAGYRSVNDVFIGWREENQPYGGQGHRRNLLGRNNLYIGIGCVYADGTYYWCQAIGTRPSGASRKQLSGPAILTASVSILISDGMTRLSAATDNLWIDEGQTIAVPEVTGRSGGWGNTSVTVLNPPWKSSNPSVLAVSNGKLTGAAGGKAQLTLDLGGQLTLNASVQCKTHTFIGDTCTVCGYKKTSAPTAKPTTVPTAKPTAAPTAKPTAAPTTKPTTAPTTKPTATPTPTGEGVKINESNFPDGSFRAFVKENFDTDGNGILSDSERRSVSDLNIAIESVRDLRGIEYLPALRSLKCSSTQVTSLDLSKNNELQSISFSNNFAEVTAEGGAFDLSTLPGFDVSKASDWQGGSVSGSTLTVTESGYVTYNYYCGKTWRLRFILRVTVTAPAVQSGDVTGDGVLDGRDALRLAKYLAGQDVKINKAAADLTGDGSIDGRDILRLVKKLAGL